MAEAAGIEPTSADRLTTVLKTAEPPGPIYFRMYYNIHHDNSQISDCRLIQRPFSLFFNYNQTILLLEK